MEVGMRVYQIRARNNTGYQAFKDFADNFFDKPRKFKFAGNKFQFIDGIATYTVELEFTRNEGNWWIIYQN